jgi:hypothetical protein
MEKIRTTSLSSGRIGRKLQRSRIARAAKRWQDLKDVTTSHVSHTVLKITAAQRDPSTSEILEGKSQT